MKKIDQKRLAAEIISSLLILLFVYTALSKLLDYPLFRLQLGKSPFITAYAGLVAWSLPIGELLVAIALVFKPTRVAGLYASLFLMTMFTTYIYAMLEYSYDIPCSCGGILSKLGWREHLWFNSGCVLLSITGIILESILAQNARAVRDGKLPGFVYTAIS